MAYLNVLNINIHEPIIFKNCCQQTIKKFSEINIEVIKNYQAIMKWNRVFHTDNFPPS